MVASAAQGHLKAVNIDIFLYLFSRQAGGR